MIMEQLYILNEDFFDEINIDVKTEEDLKSDYQVDSDIFIVINNSAKSYVKQKIIPFLKISNVAYNVFYDDLPDEKYKPHIGDNKFLLIIDFNTFNRYSLFNKFFQLMSHLYYMIYKFDSETKKEIFMDYNDILLCINNDKYKGHQKAYNEIKKSFIEQMPSGHIDLTHIDVSELLDLKFSDLYYGELDEIKTIDITGWNLKKCRQLSFESLYYLEEIKGLEDLDVSNINTMCDMFYECNSLTNNDFSKWNVSKCKSFNAMFSNCNAIEELDLSSWNTEKARDTEYMFSNMETLKKVNLTGWNTKNLINMNFMFCYSK